MIILLNKETNKMTEFETYMVGINGIIAGAYCTHIFKKLMMKGKKEFKTKRKKDYSVTIPKKLRVIKNK